MHSAPSVTYPVGRSRGATRLLVVLWALGACCAGTSCYLSDSAGWRQLLLVLSVAFAGVAAGFGLRRDGAGTLHFDGLHWSLSAGDASRSVHAARALVALDFQSLMLLRFSEPGRARRWLWVEQRAMPERWRDVRRAVYSRPPSAAPAGDTWRATAPADAP
ncbi:hypothetical protein SAMN05216567_102302 [Variovorax sp. OK605]|uniref:hypothetical protein n=1 Tax=Variovorax sp. OK605 TaxID=1855317 RepID=UPI0008E17BF9|nr:hypothetical protein [Variovorax sp. OK605]SFO72079.1 hypothetical protein SAMN05216567_102302 [Variovorax sp. OK605]